MFGGLENENGDILDFVWSLDEESLSYLLVLAERSINFNLFIILTPWKALLWDLVLIQCMLRVHIWQSFTVPLFISWCATFVTFVYSSLLFAVPNLVIQFIWVWIINYYSPLFGGSCPVFLLPGNVIAKQSLPNPGSCREAAWISWRVLWYNLWWRFFFVHMGFCCCFVCLAWELIIFNIGTADILS